MKILHTSDWHLGQIFYHYDRTEEHESFLRQLRDIVSAEQPDVMLVCGDVYHTALPQTSTQELFIRALIDIQGAAPQMRTVVIAGNHDSSARLQVEGILWDHFRVKVSGSYRRAVADGEGSESFFQQLYADHVLEIPGEGYVVALPHAYPQNIPDVDGVGVSAGRLENLVRRLTGMIAERNHSSLPVILMAHTAVANSIFTGHDVDDDGGVETVGGLDTVQPSVFGDGYDYLALGHIHTPQKPCAGARYCGTPLAVNFEETFSHSVSIVDVSERGGEVAVRTIPIQNDWEMVTLPEGEPVEFSKALAALRDFPSDQKAYIRLNVRVDGSLPADSKSLAVKAAEGKSCRYCLIRPVYETKACGSTETLQMSAEALSAQTPLDIARQYYRLDRGVELPAELEDLLRIAIESTDIVESTNTED